MKKRILSTCVLLAMICTAIFPVAAYDQEEGKKNSEQYIMDTFGYYYELYDGDVKRATEALIASKDSLSLISIKETEPGVEPYASYEFGAKTSDMLLIESIVYDNDWNTYVYNGSWEWRGATSTSELHPSNYLKPEDVIAVFSQNSNRMRVKQMILYGYNVIDGKSKNTCYYDTLGNPNDNFGFGSSLNVPNMRAFAFDETNVLRGRLSAALSYNASAGSPDDLIMMQYCHSWTEVETTGAGFSIGVGSGGANVSWESGVLHWPNPATSNGVELPSP